MRTRTSDFDDGTERYRDRLNTSKEEIADRREGVMASSNTFILLILWMIIIMIGTSNTGKSNAEINFPLDTHDTT